jgi:hypothetical protein
VQALADTEPSNPAQAELREGDAAKSNVELIGACKK